MTPTKEESEAIRNHSVQQLLAKLAELDHASTQAPWKKDEHGLYITSDRCPLCGPRQFNQVAMSPVALDEEDKELLTIRGWGHLQYHGAERAEAVQHANADLIVLLRNHAPELLRQQAERIAALEAQLAALNNPGPSTH